MPKTKPKADYSRQARYRARNWDAWLEWQRGYLRDWRARRKAAKAASPQVIHKKK